MFNGEQLKETLVHRRPCHPQSLLGDSLELSTPSPLFHHHHLLLLLPFSRHHHPPSRSHQKSPQKSGQKSLPFGSYKALKRLSDLAFAFFYGEWVLPGMQQSLHLQLPLQPSTEGLRSTPPPRHSSQREQLPQE